MFISAVRANDSNQIVVINNWHAFLLFDIKHNSRIQMIALNTSVIILYMIIAYIHYIVIYTVYC